MIVNKVIIELTGRFNIEKLADLGYSPWNKNRTWDFNGVMHRYIFEQLDDRHIRIFIEAVDKVTKLDHIITFDRIKDWVGQSVNKIQIGGVRQRQ